jgi:hypothetical protein
MYGETASLPLDDPAQVVDIRVTGAGQHVRSRPAAISTAAVENDGAILRELVDTLRQGLEWDVDSARNVTAIKFLRCAYVQQQVRRLLLQEFGLILSRIKLLDRRIHGTVPSSYYLPDDKGRYCCDDDDEGDEGI